MLWLTIGASGVALVLGGLWYAATGRVGALEAEQSKSLAERGDLVTRLDREARARKKQAEELAEIRKRTDKVKKRQAKQGKQTDQPMGTAARLSELTAESERADHARRAAEAENLALTKQLAALEAQLSDSASALETASAPFKAASEQVEEGLRPLQAEVEERREQAAKLDEALRGAKLTETRMRKRMNNQEQLYASVRAELDVKKDRIRAQEEKIQRLEALHVALSD